MKLSPYSVMVLCLLYIGIIVLFHIFGKVKGAGSRQPMSPETNEEM